MSKGLPMVVHACGQAGLFVAFHRVGRHGHNGQIVQTVDLAQGVGGLKAVHHRHLQIHQHHIKGTCASSTACTPFYRWRPG